MKKHHAFGALICAFVLVLAGGGMLLAGELCFVYDEAGECVPCEPASTHTGTTVDKQMAPAGTDVVLAGATATSTIPVRVIMPDGSQKIVALPMSLFTGAQGGRSCVSGPCGAASGTSAQLTSAKLAGNGCGGGTCVPRTECEGRKCEPCPPGACEMIEGASTTSAPSDI